MENLFVNHSAHYANKAIFMPSDEVLKRLDRELETCLKCKLKKKDRTKIFPVEFKWYLH